jgi:hypothetical protein
MNVSKYLSSRESPAPTIHNDTFLDEFKHPKHYSVVGKQRVPLVDEIEGARAFAIKHVDALPLQPASTDGHYKIYEGEHPWCQ